MWLACGKTDFRCKKTQKCIPWTYTCDGVDDCGDNSDEGGPEDIDKNEEDPNHQKGVNPLQCFSGNIEIKLRILLGDT